MVKLCNRCDEVAVTTNFKFYWLCAKCWMKEFAK